jgi:hypothetical protein
MIRLQQADEKALKNSDSGFWLAYLGAAAAFAAAGVTSYL